MTLHISLLHTLPQMWCWSWYGVTNYSVCWRVCKGQLLCMFWRSQLSVLQRHNLIWHVDRRMNRQTNWWMVWKLERLWDPPRGITDPLFPWNKQACFTVPKESKIVFLCSMFPNFAFVPCSTQNVTFVPCSPGINVISPVSQNPWEGLHYVDVIFSHIEQKRGQWMADLRINVWSDESLKCQPDLDQKFYLTLARRSRFWYQNIGGFGTKLYVHSSFATI